MYLSLADFPVEAELQMGLALADAELPGPVQLTFEFILELPDDLAFCGPHF